DDRIGRLNALVAEADRKIKLMDSLESKGAALSAFKTTVAGSVPKKSGAAAGRAAAAYGIPGRTVRPDDAVSLTKGGAGAVRQDAQNTLFDDRAAPVGGRTEVVMTESGASYAEIPVVAPKVYVSETPVVPRTDLKSEILSLFDAGLSVDDVAARLSCSLTEVQLTLSLANRI
ncbi:MAG: hypothetical protein K2H09_02615, partial [Treponemataceae bacterium]|nr:hypothetical protein [Treponemataceae bacterium]